MDKTSYLNLILHSISQNLDYFLLIFLGLVIGIFLIKHKKNVEIEKILFPFIYLILYKTKIGLKAMDNLSKKVSKNFRNFLTYSSITIGFVGMIFITYKFLESIYNYFFIQPDMVVAVLLPSSEQLIPGLPPLHFMYWIIAIFVLATVHEFSHGFFARMYNIKVKSSGFAFLGIILPIIPAAFVEPDEKQLTKSSKKAQLAVLSAGTFANFVTSAFFFLILALISGPVISQMNLESDNLIISGVAEGSPADGLGINLNSKLLSIDGFQISDQASLIRVMNETLPYQKINLITDEGSFYVTLDKHPFEERGYIGLNFF